MIYLLDTNVISETIKPTPNENVIHWLSAIPIQHLCLSVITIGEIWKGIEKISNISKKMKLRMWLEGELSLKFQGRFIVVEERVCEKWGSLCAQNNQLPAIDGLIAASAMVHGLKIVTRNTKDFSLIPGLECINPWLLERITLTS